MIDLIMVPRAAKAPVTGSLDQSGRQNIPRPHGVGQNTLYPGEWTLDPLGGDRTWSRCFVGVCLIAWASSHPR